MTLFELRWLLAVRACRLPHLFLLPTGKRIGGTRMAHQSPLRSFRFAAVHSIGAHETVELAHLLSPQANECCPSQWLNSCSCSSENLN